MSHDKRLKALERTKHSRLTTAADIIRGLQRRPKTADEFVIWERNLSDVERAAYMATVNAELAEWRQRRE
jgi:hypothetical protein